MKLHVGSGKIRIDGFINIDIEPSHEPDICGDILTMDFRYDIEVIYSCHMAEHLNYPDQMVKFLSLCYTWLKEGGIFRIGVPDLELAVRNYVNGGDLKFLYGADFKGYYYRDTPCERLNYFIKEWQHKLCYDFPLLSSLVRDAGFRIVTRKAANETMIPNFSGDRFISESMYLEAIK